MAPMAPLGRAKAIERVKKGKLPFWIGSPHPTAAVLAQDGMFRIRQLVVDEARAKEAGRKALAAGENWMPEHHHALGEPVGHIYAEAESLDALVLLMKSMRWPDDW